jgi:type II secretory pathway component GspD/PulD (secretin)
MKKTILMALLSLPLFCHAEDVALNFTAIPIVQFVQSTYRAMLKRDFVMSPDLLVIDKPITVSVRSIPSEALPQFVESVLGAYGVKSELRNGVYFLSLRDVDSAGGWHSNGRTEIRLSGPVAGTLGDFSLDGRRGALGGGSATVVRGALVDEQLETSGAERDVYAPRNRKSDFVASVLNSVFPSKPAVSAAGVVVLTASKEQMLKVRQLAEELDRPPSKVKLSATFVEVSTTESSGLGVSLVAEVLGVKLGVKLGDTSSGALTLKANSFQAVIDAISADGRFKQVAAPTAVVDDYEKSSVSFGDSVPTLASTTLDRDGNPVQQIQYQQSGVLLDVQPAVLGSGKISVLVDGQVSSFSATTTGVAGSPTLSKRQVKTSVTMDDGELLLIGGLNNNKVVANTTAFSFLPKSWSARSNSLANTDLVLVLSASVIK